MTQPDLQINEYVWDRTWDGPAIVTMLEIEAGATRYRVAEINEQRKLGRTAWRDRDQLCRYVRVLIPEDEALAILLKYRKRTTPEIVSLMRRARERITKQLQKRGVDVPG